MPWDSWWMLVARWVLGHLLDLVLHVVFGRSTLLPS